MQLKIASYLIGITFFLLLVFPFSSPGDYVTHIAIICLYYSVLAISWNLVAGYMGQFSLGHAALIGIGGYASGLLAVYVNIPIFLGMLVGGILAMMLSVGYGLVSVRIKGAYLVIITISLSEFFRLIVLNEWEITGGTAGLRIPFFIPGHSSLLSYYLITLIFCVEFLLIHKIVNSTFGLSLKAIRDDVDATSAMGVDVRKHTIIAFAISGFFAGIAGSFYAHFILLAGPEMVSLTEMFIILIAVLLGGIGTEIGPIIGAFVYEVLSELLRDFGYYHLLAFGVVMLVIVRSMSRGLYSVIDSIRLQIMKAFENVET